MKPRPVGRPPRVGKSAADNRITLRLTDAELAAWTKQAGDLALGEWIRQTCSARCPRGVLDDTKKRR